MFSLLNRRTALQFRPA